MSIWDTVAGIGTLGLYPAGKAIYNAASSGDLGGLQNTAPRQVPQQYYGGSLQASQQQQQRLQALGAQQGPQIDYTQAGNDRALQLQARGSQGNAMGLLQQAAMGNAPSQAQLQMGQGISQATRQQMAAAASARGGAYAQGAAAQQAAQQGAQMQAQGIGQAAQLRAQEMAQARGQYMDAASQQRAQDLQSQGLSAEQAQAQAQLEMQQRQLGLGYEQLAQGVGSENLQAGLQAQQIGAGEAAQNAQLGQNLLQGLVGAGGGIAAAAASDERLKKDVRKAGKGKASSVADALLDALGGSAATYEYKDPGFGEGKRAGVMAQDLERVPQVGHQMVADTPIGKVVGTTGLAHALAMGVGRLHERLKALEGKR